MSDQRRESAARNQDNLSGSKKIKFLFCFKKNLNSTHPHSWGVHLKQQKARLTWILSLKLCTLR